MCKKNLFTVFVIIVVVVVVVVVVVIVIVIVHGITSDNQRYPLYFTEHWYILGIPLVYA